MRTFGLALEGTERPALAIILDRATEAIVIIIIGEEINVFCLRKLFV
jgi:hypothetical protein